MEQFAKVNVSRSSHGYFIGWFVGQGPNGMFAVARKDDGKVILVEATAIEFVVPEEPVHAPQIASGEDRDATIAALRADVDRLTKELHDAKFILNENRSRETGII